MPALPGVNVAGRLALPDLTTTEVDELVAQHSTRFAAHAGRFSKIGDGTIAAGIKNIIGLIQPGMPLIMSVLKLFGVL